MFVFRNGRVVEVVETKVSDDVVLGKEEYDLGTREEALAAVDRRIAVISSEKAAVLGAPEGEESIPRTDEPFAKKNYVYLIGDYVYSCYCEYDEAGNLKTFSSGRVGLKEEIIRKYDAMIVDLNTRYQGILNAVEG